MLTAEGTSVGVSISSNDWWLHSLSPQHKLVLVLCCFRIVHGSSLTSGDTETSKACYVLLVALDIPEVVRKLDERWNLPDIGCLEGEPIAEK